MAQVTVGGETYYINEKLKRIWDDLKDGKLTKVDNDRVYIVDGRERSGKSVFALQQAAYIDPTIIKDVKERIVFNPRDLLEAIRNTKSNQNETRSIIFDEAFRGLSSRGVNTTTNKQIVQAMVEMGQKNLVVFIVLPSLFMLEQYAAVFRSHALFHIKRDDRRNKRSFYVYNYTNKKALYLYGKPRGWTYNKPHIRFRDYFFGKYPGGKVFEEEYRRIKHESLVNMGKEMEENIEESKDKKYKKILAANLYYYLKSLKGTTQEQLVKALREVGMVLGQEHLSEWHTEVREKKGIIQLS